MLKIFLFSLFCSLFVTNCSLPAQPSFKIEKTVRCIVPMLSEDSDSESSVTDVPIELQYGFESEGQKKNWGNKKGYPLAQIIHGSQKVKIPVKGLVGDTLQPMEPTLSGNVCEGSVGVMDSLSRLWLVFGQADPTKVVFMAYDLKSKKIVAGHAPPQRVFSLKYQVGQLFYQTARQPNTPTRAFLKKDGKAVALKEMTLPYWVRLDLSGQQRASIDAARTFSASAFRSLFSQAEDFHRFFGLSDEGTYKKQWAYLANIGAKTCLIAEEERASGELSSQDMLCRTSGKAPASIE